MKRAIIFIFFTFVGLIYLNNLTRDVYGGDIGDLVTAAYVFGVAHPPGYPLFSLVGYIFSHLPIPLPVVSKVGLISVFASLAGLVIYFKYCLKVTKNVFLSLLSTSILAFSYLFWLTAEIPEGLGLNNFFVIIILYLAIRFYEKKKTRDLYLLMLFIGLSMTHQFYILTLFPAIFLLISKHVKYIFSNKRFIFAGLFLIIGLSVYIYVPIAASRNPPINWGQATNLKNFFHLVLRKDYGGILRVGKNTSFLVRIVNINHYLKTISDTFSYQIIFVAVLGMITMYKHQKRLIISLLIGFVLSGVLTIFIMAGPVYTPVVWGISERYYSVSAIVLMFIVPYGFLSLKNFFNSKFSQSIYSYLILSYFIIIPGLLFYYNFPKTNLSRTNIGNNLAKNILDSLPKNAVLFISGDNVIFNVWYRYYVLKKRQDIDIINPAGVGNNLYFDKELNDYYVKNPQVEMGDLVSKTIETISKKRPLFTSGIITPIPKGIKLIPKGLVFEIINDSEIPKKENYLVEIKEIWKKIFVHRREKLKLAEDNFLASEIPSIYARGLFQTANFIAKQYDDSKTAVDYYRQAIWADNTYSLAYSGLAISLFESSRDCEKADFYIRQAIFLVPVWKPYYQQQYYFAKQCQFGNEEIE